MLRITKDTLHYIKCTSGITVGAGLSYIVLDYMITDAEKHNKQLQIKSKYDYNNSNNIHTVLNK